MRCLWPTHGHKVALFCVWPSQVRALFACQDCPQIVGLLGWWVSEVDQFHYRFNMAMELMESR